MDRRPDRQPSPPPEPRVLVTCEHAGNRVPEVYRSLFEGRGELLASHRGWDPGALTLARRLSREAGGTLRYSLTTRLLVDPNRTPGNRTLFSEVTRTLPEKDRSRLVSRYHRRHWNKVRRVAEQWLRHGSAVIHLGVHTFTPVLNGVERRVDVGVLYDPSRELEAELAGIWARELSVALPHLRIGHNEPYRGTADGLTTSLRRRLSTPRYLGIELEVSQALMAPPGPDRVRTAEGVGSALVAALRRFRRPPSTAPF